MPIVAQVQAVPTHLQVRVEQGVQIEGVVVIVGREADDDSISVLLGLDYSFDVVVVALQQASFQVVLPQLVAHLVEADRVVVALEAIVVV